MKNGFTILEFLIYIFILVAAVTGMTLIISNVFQTGTRTDVIQEVNHNGMFAMQRMGQAIKGSSGITNPETTENVLELSFEDPDKNPTIFDLNEGKLRIKEGSEDYTNLTTNKVRVNSLVFKKISNDSVGIEMIVSFYNPQGFPEYEFKNFFTSSFVLRN